MDYLPGNHKHVCTINDFVGYFLGAQQYGIKNDCPDLTIKNNGRNGEQQQCDKLDRKLDLGLQLQVTEQQYDCCIFHGIVT